MAWTALTAADVETALSGPELEAYRRKAGTSDGSDDDKLAEIIAQVTDEIRAHIEDCAENRVGAAGTLPERVHYHALALVRFRLMTRIGSKISAERSREQEQALEFFRRVSECKVKIEQPDAADVVEEANTPEIEVVASQTSQAKRSQLGGLY